MLSVRANGPALNPIIRQVCPPVWAALDQNRLPWTLGRAEPEGFSLEEQNISSALGQGLALEGGKGRAAFGMSIDSS